MSVPDERLICLAVKDGDVEAPVELLRALQGEDSPLNVFSARVEAEAVSAQWPSDWHMHVCERSVDSHKAYLARIRWLRTRLVDWSSSLDDSRSLFACLLITARACGGWGNLWEALPEDYRPSAEFLNEAAKILTNFRMSYDKLSCQDMPISEEELVQQFEAHDNAFAWDKIAQVWPQLSNAMRPSLYLEELTRCLARFDMSALADVANMQPKVLGLMLISLGLSRARKLQLAIQCTSRRARFCMTLSVVEESGCQSLLSATEHDALVAVLSQVTKDAAEWRRWMSAFNRYPIRYPVIQLALGETLASAPTYAIEAYVTAICLSSQPAGHHFGGGSRSNVTRCLEKFAAAASQQTRKIMWHLSFQRWMQWRRSVDSHPNGHFDIQWSELDFAVTSYVAECLTSLECDQAMDAIRHELCHLDEVWHPSVTDYVTRVNVLLSLFQPYGHIAKGARDGYMLPVDQTYWPIETKKSSYSRQLFRVS
jgi:hypothetical protein